MLPLELHHNATKNSETACVDASISTNVNAVVQRTATGDSEGQPPTRLLAWTMLTLSGMENSDLPQLFPGSTIFLARGSSWIAGSTVIEWSQGKVKESGSITSCRSLENATMKRSPYLPVG